MVLLLLNDHITQADFAAVHVETTGKDPFMGKISSISIGIPQQPPIVISLSDLNADARLKQLLSGPSIKIFCDAKTSIKFLQRNGVEVRGSLFDVDLADKLLKAGLPRRETSLAGLAQEYGVTEGTPTKTLLALNTVLRERLAQEKLDEVAALEFETISAVAQMELTGLLLDRGRWEKAKVVAATNYARHIHPITGRLHAGYDQLGAATGRFTCKDPNVHGIPRGVRNCFVASPGHRLIKADYSQQEVRIVAEITKDRRMIEDISNGLDLHRHFASVILNKAPADVADRERQIAKAMVFSLLYGGGAQSLQDALQSKGIVLDLGQVRELRNQFFRRYTGFTGWYESLKRAPVREIRTLSGRRRLWTECASFPEACNTPIQGTGADILKKTLSLLPDALGDIDAKIVACVHDEILLEVAAEG